jgi:hypothetical protein
MLLPQRLRLFGAAKRVERIGSDAGAFFGTASKSFCRVRPLRLRVPGRTRGRKGSSEVG